VIVIDDRTSTANVAAALGWALPEAVELVSGRRPRIWLVPPSTDRADSEQVIAPRSVDAILKLQPGPAVTREPLDTWRPVPATMFY
jgi:hypothetical protein